MYAWIRIAVWNVVWRETLTYFCDVGSLSHMHYYPDNTQTPECSGPGARLLHQSLMHEYRREEDWRRMQITKEEEEEWHLTRKMKRASFSAHWQKDWQIQEKLMCGSTALMYCNKTSGVWKLTISDGNNTFLSYTIHLFLCVYYSRLDSTLWGFAGTELLHLTNIIRPEKQALLEQAHNETDGKCKGRPALACTSHALTHDTSYMSITWLFSWLLTLDCVTIQNSSHNYYITITLTVQKLLSDTPNRGHHTMLRIKG